MAPISQVFTILHAGPWYNNLLTWEFDNLYTFDGLVSIGFVVNIVSVL